MLSKTKIVHFDPMNTPITLDTDLACRVYIYTGSTYAIPGNDIGYIGVYRIFAWREIGLGGHEKGRASQMQYSQVSSI